MVESASFKRCPCPEHKGPRLLSPSDFSKDSSKPDGLQSWCKACMKRAHDRWVQANPEKQRARGRRWERANAKQRLARTKRAQAALRDQVLDHYGRVCACPGCGATKRLTIDHVNGDGKAHRLEVFGTSSSATYRLYAWLISNGFPEEFQVFCLPCNSSKQNGVACQLNHHKLNHDQEMTTVSNDIIEVPMSEALEAARALGAEHGQNAASWSFDGNTTHETYVRALRGIREGDPLVLDSFPSEPRGLGDEYTVESLYYDLNLVYDPDRDADEIAQITEAFEQAERDAFWAEVERAAIYQVESER
jgi:hypothetical protein